MNASEGVRITAKRKNGGAGGIRTLDTAFQPYNGLANRRLQPLGHSSVPAFGAKPKPVLPTILARKAALLHQNRGGLKQPWGAPRSTGRNNNKNRDRAEALPNADKAGIPRPV